MDIAETIVQLVAHLGVLEAEVQRIDDDVTALRALSARYLSARDVVEGVDVLLGSQATHGPTVVRSSSSFAGGRAMSSPPQQHRHLSSGCKVGCDRAVKQLLDLRAKKIVWIAEIQQQLALFRLHHAMGAQLTRKLASMQSLVVPPVLGSALSVLSDSTILATESS